MTIQLALDLRPPRRPRALPPEPPEPCQVCMELGRAGIDVPCSICTPAAARDWIARLHREVDRPVSDVP